MVLLDVMLAIGFFIISFGAVKGISIARARLHSSPVDEFEVENMLRRRSIWKRFESGMIYCSECGDVVTFQNLGTLSEDEQSHEIDFICRKPVCLELYLKRLESTMWDYDEVAS